MTGGNKEQTLSFDEANIKTVIIGGEKLDIGSYKAGFNNQWVMQAGGVICPHFNGQLSGRLNVSQFEVYRR